jgi:hypothetical protein
MRVCLLSFGRSYKTRHSDEFHKSYGFRPKNAGNCPLKKLERQDSFSCRSIATAAIYKMWHPSMCRWLTVQGRA